MQCIRVSSGALTDVFASYELYAESTPDPLSFMSIDATTGVITTTSTSVSSGDHSYKVKATGKAGDGFSVS
jgi:hypothetical protein